jgi:glutaredoxin
MHRESEAIAEPGAVQRAQEALAAFERSLTPEEKEALRYLLRAPQRPENVWPADRQVPVDAAQVTLYALPACSACKLAASFLAERGVKVVVKDVTADRVAARELVQVRRGVSGAVGVFPLIVVGQEVVTGFDALRLRQLLLPEPDSREPGRTSGAETSSAN